MTAFSSCRIPFSISGPARRTARLGLGVLATATGLVASAPASAQQLAFPGVEGAGRFVTGGRGRAATPTTVFEVTSLADTKHAGHLALRL